MGHENLCVDYSKSHKMKDDLFFLSKNGRQPQLFQKWKTTSIFSKMKEDFNFFFKLKKTSIFSKWKTTPKPKLILGLAKLSKIDF
jgi:hypothetical protein